MLRLLALACLLPGAAPAAATGANSDFDSWVDRFAVDWMRADPTNATYTQYFTGTEQDALDRQLTPNTAAVRTATVARARAGLAALAEFDRAGLTDSQRVSAETLAWQLETVVRGEPCADHDFVFHQFRGLQVSLVNFLTQAHPIRNRRDIENYLADPGVHVPIIRSVFSNLGLCTPSEVTSAWVAFKESHPNVASTEFADLRAIFGGNPDEKLDASKLVEYLVRAWKVLR